MQPFVVRGTGTVCAEATSTDEAGRAGQWSKRCGPIRINWQNYTGLSHVV